MQKNENNAEKTGTIFQTMAFFAQKTTIIGLSVLTLQNRGKDPKQVHKRWFFPTKLTISINLINLQIMKLKMLLVALLLNGGGNLAFAQTDVTSQYIQNPGFEDGNVRFYDINTDRGVEKPNGWSVEWYQDDVRGKNGMTFIAETMHQDNKTWKAPFGKAYMGRMRWENATLYLRQTMCDLRPGKYSLSFKATAYTDTDGAGTLSVFVAGQTKDVTVETTDPSSWNTYTIDFEAAEGKKYATIEVVISRTKDKNFKFGIDQFSLTYDGSTYYSSIIAKAQELYDNNKDWATGADVLLQAIQDNSGKTIVSEINAAIESLEAAMRAFKSANTVDMTDRITNPTFDSNINGWTCTGGDGNAYQFQNSKQVNFEGGFLEKWRDSWIGAWNQKDFDVCQTINNLPKGEYIIKAAIMAQMQGGKESLKDTYTNKKHGGPYYIDDEHGVWLYGTSGSETSTTWANSENSTLISGVGAVYRTATVDVQDGSLTIGFKGVGSPKGGTELGTYANWVACDNWTLSYFGFDPTSLLNQLSELRSEAGEVLADVAYTNVTGSERTELTSAKDATVEETKVALDAAILRLRKAIDAFKAAKTAYDNYQIEKSTADKFGISLDAPNSAADAEAKMKEMNVAEFNKVSKDYTTSIELGTWTTNGAATFHNEHWSGNDVDYLNQNDSNGQGWNSTSWTMTCEQTITLPEGEYVFKAAGRKSTNAYLDLLVKAGETELGVVSNFPNGNVGLGITKSGKASFDPSETYARNENTGYGWQWRFVPFTLTKETDVTFTISAGANEIHNWASFGDYTVMVKPNIAASKIAYEQAVAKADAAKVDYPIAACTELTGLENAKTVTSETVEGYENAIAAIESAIAALTDARTAYQSLAEAKSITQDELPYAAAEKYTALQNAIAVETTADITKNIAETYASAITTALRAYYESNAKAEKVSGVDYTEKLPVSKAADAMPAIWYAELRVNKGQGATDSEGTVTESYFDSNSTFYGSANLTAHLTQTVEGLPTGKYLVTVQARGASYLKSLTLTAGSESMDLSVQSPKGVFGNMWDDYSLLTSVDKSGSLTIKVSGITNSKSSWFSFNDIRLYRLGDLDEVALDEDANNTITAGLAKVTLKRTIVEGVWNTLVLPFEMSNEEVLSVFGEGAKVAAFSNADANDVYFTTTEEGVKANTPVLIQAAARTEFTFDGYTLVEGTAKAEGAMFDFVGSYAPTNLANGEYMLSGNKFWKNEDKGYNVKGFRAYLSPKTSTEVKSLNLIMDDVATGITIADLDADAEGKTYNMAGQRVSSNYKGLVIKNGKKAVIK